MLCYFADFVGYILDMFASNISLLPYFFLASPPFGDERKREKRDSLFIEFLLLSCGARLECVFSHMAR